MPSDTERIRLIKRKYSKQLQKLAEASGKRPKDILKIVDDLDKHFKIFETLAAAQLDPSINTPLAQKKLVALCPKPQ